MTLQELLEKKPMPEELASFVKKWKLNELGFVYERSIEHLHVFDLDGTHRLWLVDGVGRVTKVTRQPIQLTKVPVFKSHLKLLRLLVDLDCQQAIAMVRQNKIKKMLS